MAELKRALFKSEEILVKFRVHSRVWRTQVDLCMIGGNEMGNENPRIGKHDSALGKWWVLSSLTVLAEGKQWAKELVNP